MTRKEKFNMVRAGVGCYAVSSFIAWLKEGGLEFVNRQEMYSVNFHKTLGIIDVIRFEGHLQKLDIFGGDWVYLVGGLLSPWLYVLVLKFIDWINSEEKGSTTERTAKGMKVKIKRPVPPIRDFQA